VFLTGNSEIFIMDSIQKIRDAEKEAARLVETAKKRSDDIVRAAEEDQRKKLAALDDILKKEAAETHDQQKKRLATMYRSIMEKGKVETAKILEKARGAYDKAKKMALE